MKNSDHKTHKELIDKGWSLLKQDLDAILPTERKRRFVAWWWLFPLLLAIGFGAWWLLGDTNTGRSNQSAEQQFMVQKTEGSISSHDGSEKIATGFSSQVESEEFENKNRRDLQVNDVTETNHSQSSATRTSNSDHTPLNRDNVTLAGQNNDLQHTGTEQLTEAKVAGTTEGMPPMYQESHVTGQNVVTENESPQTSDQLERTTGIVGENASNNGVQEMESGLTFSGVVELLACLPIQLLESDLSISYKPLMYTSEHQVKVSRTDHDWILSARSSVADDPSDPGYGLGLASAYSWNDRWQFSFGIEYVHVRLKDNISNIDVPQEYAVLGGFEAVNNVAASNQLGEYDWLINYSALYFPLKLDYLFKRKLGLGMAVRPGLIVDNKLEIIEFPDMSRLNVEDYVHTDLKNQFDIQLSPSLSWYFNKSLSLTAFWEVGMIQFNASGRDNSLDFIYDPFSGNREANAQYFQTNNLGLRINWHF